MKPPVARWVGAALTAVLAVVPACALVGCDATAPNYAEQRSQAAQGDTSTSGRRFTVPAAYFGNRSPQECEQLLEEQGGLDIERNDDGSYTVTMSDRSFELFCYDDLQQTKKVLDAIPRSRDYPQVISVDYDDSLTQVTFTCSSKDMGEQGQNAANLAAYVCCLHQTIAGEQLSCTVTLEDGSGAAIATYRYPDDVVQQQ